MSTDSVWCGQVVGDAGRTSLRAVAACRRLAGRTSGRVCGSGVQGPRQTSLAGKVPRHTASCLQPQVLRQRRPTPRWHVCYSLLASLTLILLMVLDRLIAIIGLSSPIDSILARMIVWTLRGKINQNCSVLYFVRQLCTMRRTCWFRFRFCVCLFEFTILRFLGLA